MVQMFWLWLIGILGFNPVRRMGLSPARVCTDRTGLTASRRIAPNVAALLAIVGSVTAGGAARAELLDYSVPVQVLDVGGVCFSKHEKTELAPNIANQELWIFEHDRVYAVHGDVFAARPGVSIELIVSLGYYIAGKSYSIELEYPDAAVDQWNFEMAEDGVIRTGHAVYEKEMLPTGTYTFRAYDGQRLLFSYRVTVEGYGDKSPCEPQVS